MQSARENENGRNTDVDLADIDEMLNKDVIELLRKSNENLRDDQKLVTIDVTVYSKVIPC